MGVQSKVYCCSGAGDKIWNKKNNSRATSDGNTNMHPWKVLIQFLLFVQWRATVPTERRNNNNNHHLHSTNQPAKHTPIKNYQKQSSYPSHKKT
mmetsp:Transcript_5219/g.7956  ORF Transcript_5219/g.7956 Transcript_5219/m.7956 type:complete len:94 (-) Transcript_5219:1809-2090(-)